MAATILPASLTFEGNEMPLWTYTQLERLGRPQLKQRALNLRDAIGADRLPAMNAASIPATIAWIIQVQVSLLVATGTQCSGSDFGLPKDFGVAEASYFGGGGAGQPAASTDKLESDAGNPDLVQAYTEAQRGAEAAKARNRGSGIF